MDWKATNLKKSNVHVLQMGGLRPTIPPARYFATQAACLEIPSEGVQDYIQWLRHPHPLLFCSASTMPNSFIKEATRSDLHPFFVKCVGCALPNLPRYFATSPSKGCKKLGVLIFVNLLHMFRSVSTMQDTSYQRVQEAECSNVLLMVHVCPLRGPAPFNPPAIC